ncbi:MAG: ABC transporter permease, partial [Bacteroidales bacterium]|nr:ABC transporter permease [Bacteroidales bacterium]
RSNLDEAGIYQKLKSVLTPSDVGLRIRKNSATGTVEIISSRIFFDETLISKIREIIPSASPLITYLVNGTRSKTSFNPYSFASGIPASVYPEIPAGRRILVNRWLADDIGIRAGDSVILSWFEPDRINELTEREEAFEVSGIVDLEGKWDDPDLMPEFPGITGQVSCSRWDAGVKLKTELIRNKDEEYWNLYQGTPKIFMSYETGKQLWGNNFGPATAIRIPAEEDGNEVFLTLTGNIDPAAAGFRVINIRDDMLQAASSSVDFSSLFLGLGFFIIISCLMLLALSVSSFLERRRDEIFTFFATGYSNKKIFYILLSENFIITSVSAFAGALAGILFNFLVIRALNSVWSGAVNTSSLSPYTGILPLAGGFAVTVIISLIIQYLRIRKYLKEMSVKESRVFRVPGRKAVLLKSLLTFAVLPAIIFLSILNMINGASVAVSYLTGGLIFTGLIVAFRYLLTIRPTVAKENEIYLLSVRYYAMYPSRAVLPVLLIASGLFAVIATG